VKRDILYLCHCAPTLPDKGERIRAYHEVKYLARRYRVHVDIGVNWSGVLYLNRPEQCRGGTSFFRHRGTRSDHAPTTAADLVRCNAKTAQEALDRILGTDSNDPAQWETTVSVPMQFNRLVLFRPLLWHSAGEGFGDSTANGRLVQLFFLRSASPSAAQPPRT
jgi:hypothetical protein